MSIYNVNPIGGSGGFKVHVADDVGGLRVVGVFFTEADAKAWIAVDSQITARLGGDGQHRLSGPQ
jgi:hypothetical protein